MGYRKWRGWIVLCAMMALPALSMAQQATKKSDVELSREGPAALATAHGEKPRYGGKFISAGVEAVPLNWLQVLDTAERTQIYQRVRHQFHAVVSLLDAFKAEQQPLELVLPGKGPLNPQA